MEEQPQDIEEQDSEKDDEEIVPTAKPDPNFEAVDWEAEDVITLTTTTDGKLLKKIITPGVGNLPEEGSKVSIHVEGWLSDRTKFDCSRERKVPIVFTFGAGAALPCFELAVRSMKQGEKARFLVPPSLAYGPLGVPYRIPPNATLDYAIELLSFENRRVHHVETVEQRIVESQKMREEGNRQFGRKAWRKAIAAYNKALMQFYGVRDEDMTNEELEQVNALKVVLYTNIAACNLQQKDAWKAVENCRKALEIAPQHKKAKYRLGRAYELIGDYERAFDAMEELLRLDPTNLEVIGAHKELQAKAMSARKQRDLYCAGIFGDKKSSS